MTKPPRVQTETYLDVLDFYAHQMPQLESGDYSDFAKTFTPDGSFEHAQQGWALVGREAIEQGLTASMPRYGNSRIRHWFDKIRISEAAEGRLEVAFTAIVSMTDEQGQVVFEPSCEMRDVLVRDSDGTLLTHNRVIRHDVANAERYWAGLLAQQSA